MSLKWSENVVGGMDKPRYLLCGPELSPNISFEDDLTGISGSIGAYERALDETSHFGDYVLTVEDDSDMAQEYVDITISTGTAIAGKRFIVTAWVRNDDDDNDQAVWTLFEGLSDTHEKQFVCDGEWRPLIVHEVLVPGDASGTDLVYRIYPFGKSTGDEGQGKIRIDNFKCREVLEHFEMPLPQRGGQKQMWSREYQSRHDLVDGRKKSYLRGMRYFYEARYEQMTAANEVLRSKTMNTSMEILFFPHRDAPVCYFVEWDRDFERTWAYGVAPFGHETNIDLAGTEVLPLLPDVVIDELTEYEYPDDNYYFEQLGDSMVFTS